jgi:hypothetical protein
VSGQSTGVPSRLVSEATGAIRLVITQSFRHGFEAGSTVKPARCAISHQPVKSSPQNYSWVSPSQLST